MVEASEGWTGVLHDPARQFACHFRRIACQHAAWPNGRRPPPKPNRTPHTGSRQQRLAEAATCGVPHHVSPRTAHHAIGRTARHLPGDGLAAKHGGSGDHHRPAPAEPFSSAQHRLEKGPGHPAPGEPAQSPGRAAHVGRGLPLAVPHGSESNGGAAPMPRRRKPAAPRSLGPRSKWTFSPVHPSRFPNRSHHH